MSWNEIMMHVKMYDAMLNVWWIFKVWCMYNAWLWWLFKFTTHV